MSTHGQTFAKFSLSQTAGWSAAICGLLALAVAVGVGRFAFTPILPMMQDDVGLTVREGGLLASANYVGYLVGALWAMVQRARPDHAIRVALAVSSASTIAMAYADAFAAWMVLRLVAGIASAWGLIHVTSWCVERLTPLKKPLLNGVLFSGVGVGIILAGALCLILMGSSSTSNDAWLLLGGFGVAITVLVWPVLGVHSKAKPAMAAPKYEWNADAARLVGCYGAFGLGYIIPATFVPLMAKQVIVDPALFGWAWPAFGAAAVLSTLFAAPLMRRLSNRRLWMLSAVIMALGVASPLAVPGLTGIIISAVLVGGTFMVLTMAGIQEARVVAGASASVLVAAMTAAFAAGQILGPLLVSMFAGRSNQFSGILMLAFAVLIVSVLALVPFSKKGL